MPPFVAAGIAYFIAVFAAGFALGVVRTVLLVPALGAVPAVLLELPVMLAIAWLASGRVLRRWPLDRAGAVAAGALFFLALMAAEAGISVWLAGRSLAEHAQLFALPEHWLGLAAQLLTAAFPALRARA